MQINLFVCTSGALLENTIDENSARIGWRCSSFSDRWMDDPGLSHDGLLILAPPTQSAGFINPRNILAKNLITK